MEKDGEGKSPEDLKQKSGVSDPVVVASGQGWSSGLFDFKEDWGGCVMACYTPCNVYGQMAEILDKGNPSCTDSALKYWCLGHLCCMNGWMSSVLRKRVREMYGITEDHGDFLVSCFCETCSLAQVYREFKSRGIEPGLGWAHYAGQDSTQKSDVPTPPVMTKE